MNGTQNVENLSDIEYKVLQILKENSRISLTEISRILGISRITAGKVIKNLQEKGVKFTVSYEEEGLIAFVISSECEGKEDYECYKLVDGRYILLIKSKNLKDLSEKISKVKEKREIYIAVEKVGKKFSFSVKCDYCGKIIKESPIIYKYRRRKHYACCEACLNGIKERLKVI
jgi:DNA-binding Lrp family transcriptional regulator